MRRNKKLILRLMSHVTKQTHCNAVIFLLEANYVEEKARFLEHFRQALFTGRDFTIIRTRRSILHHRARLQTDGCKVYVVIKRANESFFIGHFLSRARANKGECTGKRRNGIFAKFIIVLCVLYTSERRESIDR